MLVFVNIDLTQGHNKYLVSVASHAKHSQKFTFRKYFDVEL